MDDWPAMAQGRANLRRIPPGLTDATKALLSFSPAEPGQQVAQERAVIAIEQALEARRHRIVLSQATISPIQWLVIFLLDVLILLTIAFVHLNRPATVVVNLIVFSTAVASVGNEDTQKAGGPPSCPTGAPARSRASTACASGSDRAAPESPVAARSLTGSGHAPTGPQATSRRSCHSCGQARSSHARHSPE